MTVAIPQQPIKDKTESCFHCDTPITDERIVEADKLFCCNGCLQVHHLLSSSGMDAFYKLNQQPGNKIKPQNEQQWAFLSLPEVEAELLSFKNDNLSKLELNLPGIHCSSCIWLLEHLHKLEPAVKSCQVNFSKRTASILWQHQQLSLQNLAVLLSKLGYPPDVQLGAKQKAQKQKNPLVRQLAVAGFCFGNTMLLSLPEYLDTTALLEAAYTSIFRWLNLLLCLPVMLFSAKVFYSSAWAGLRQRFINMDVPIAIGISVLFLRSLFEVYSGSGSGYADSLCGLVFFLLIGRWYQSKTYEALRFDREVKSYFPIAVTRVADGEEELVQVKELGRGRPPAAAQWGATPSRCRAN